MRTVPSSRLRLSLLTLTLGVALLVPLGRSSAAPESSVPSTGAAAADTVLTPDAVPLSAGELANPDRGQSKWQGIPTDPPGWPTSNVYYRDQIYWGKIEKQRGVYDFSSVDAGLADAATNGGRLDLRVMAWCPGCWMEFSTNPDKPPSVPTWMPRQGGTWKPPKWNSETFLSSWEDLMAELGTRYADDPRLGWIDIGGYGAYGEWHITEGEPISTANAVRVARAVLRAFPDRPVLVNAMDPRLVLPVLDLSPRVGWRHDCLGADFFGWMTAQYPTLRERWKTAPVSSEWCHSGDVTMARGLQQVRDQHVSSVSSGNMPVPYASMSSSEQAAFRSAAKRAGYRYGVARVEVPSRLRLAKPVPVELTWTNAGSAPTYDRWAARLGLANASGKVLATAPVPTDLRSVRPGRRVSDLDVRFSGTVPSGRYSLVLQVRDPSGYAAPMRLAIRGRGAGGWYSLGKVQVG